jgi:hypothetical protein
METVTAEMVPRMVDEVLIKHCSPAVHPLRQPATLHTVVALVERLAEEKQLSVNWPLIWPTFLDYWWSLCRLGVVAIPGTDWRNESSRPPGIVTPWGLERLQRGDDSPHDPERYLTRLRARVATPDSIVIAYIGEALAALRAGLFRSTVVMAGCAYERVVRALASAAAPRGPKLGKLASDPRTPVAALADALLETLKVCDLPGDLAEPLERRLAGPFEHARGLRNENGHPTGKTASEDDARSAVVLFPPFYGYAEALRRELEK